MKMLKAILSCNLFLILFFSPLQLIAQEQQISKEIQEEWVSLIETSNLLLEEEKYDEALTTAYQALEFAEEQFGDSHPQTISSMFNLAIMLMDLGDSEQAEPLLDMTHELSTQVLGSEHPETIATLFALARLYGDQGLYEQAQEILEGVLEKRRQFFGDSNAETLETMTTLAQIYQVQGVYDKAEELLNIAVNEYIVAAGNDSPDTVFTQESLASIYSAQGKFKEAEPLYLEVYQQKLKLYGAQDEETLITKSSIAELFRRMGSYQKSEKWFVETIDVMKLVLGEENPELYATMGNLASLLEDLGRYDDAEELFQKVWEFDRSSLGEKHPNTIIDMNNLAGLYRKQGNYGEAEEFYENSLEFIKEALGEDHPETLSIMNNLALLYENQGLYEKAEPLFKGVVRSGRTTLGPRHPKTLAFMNNLALLYESQGLFDKSEPLYRETIDLNKEIFGAEHSNTTASVNNLGYLYLMQEEYKEAEPLFENVYQIWGKELGKSHQKTLKAMNNLARALHHQNKLDPAEELFNNALALRKEVLGGSHPDVIRSQIDLSTLYISQKKYSKAKELLLDTLTLSEERLGENHQYTFETLHALSDLYEITSQTEDALETRLLTFNRRTEFFDRVLWATGENTRQSYIQLHKDEQHNFLRLITATNSPETSKLALHASLQRKGLLLKIASEIQKVVEMNNNADLSDLSERLLENRKTLAAMTLSGPKNETPAEFQKRLVDLESEVDDIQAELGRSSAAFRSASQVVMPDGIFENIGDDAVLVDYIAYEDSGVSKMIALVVQNSAQGCFILWECKKAQVDLVELGELEPIRKSVSYFREAIQDEEAEEEDLLETGNEIYKLIWAPIEKHFGNKSLIYVVPDSALHLLPFDAMIDDEERYLIQTRDLRFLSSSRDLVIAPLKRAQGDFTIFAGANYDSDYLKEHRKKIISSGTSRGVAKGMRIASNGMRSLSFEPLDGAELEGESIKNVSDKKESNSFIYSQNTAQEQQLRGFKKPPQMLHIATHGFFLGAEESLVKRLLSIQRGGQQKIPPPGDNPLLRAGLAFAGINANAPFLGEVDTDNDGVLTAMEVLNLNLSGTRLVVLSACETGVGEIHAGEGVYGLRRAFQEAGVENVVNSLWPVSDEGTRRLMTGFYQRLFEGVSIRQSLKDSQLDLIDSDDWNHPYYWSAFVMVTKRDGSVQN
ncbi:MAG: CHAT domain-containing protein [Proteobacteria bacterium]|nr:CHAT domain-containing protein [Pseudomonadota bacterium]